MAMIEIDETELKTLRKNAAAYEAMQPQLTEYKAKAERLPALEQQLAQLGDQIKGSTYERHGITDPKVRKLFDMEHAEQAGAEGGQADLGAWLDSIKALAPDKRPAILAPFMAQQAAQPGTQQAAAPGQQRTMPGAGAGAKTPPAAPTEWTAERIAELSKNPQELRQNWPAIQAAIPQLGGLNLPGGTQPAPSTTP